MAELLTVDVNDRAAIERALTAWFEDGPTGDDVFVDRMIKAIRAAATPPAQGYQEGAMNDAYGHPGGVRMARLFDSATGRHEPLCPACRGPLLTAKVNGEQACADPECIHAHGLREEAAVGVLFHCVADGCDRCQQTVELSAAFARMGPACKACGLTLEEGPGRAGAATIIEEN
jgi:hypothetical protein